MSYDIIENLLPETDSDRPGVPLNPTGWVIHSTACKGATDENIRDYFANHNADASCHYVVDWDSITRVIPESEEAYHAGPTANKMFLSLEICETKENNPDDPAQFAEAWKRAVWLVGKSCNERGWDPDEAIHSHLWVSNQWHEVNHTDPYEYFKQHGKTMEDFIKDVKIAMEPPKTAEQASDWAKSSWEKAIAKGIIKGDGKVFNPQANVSREALMTILDRLGLL